LICEKFKRYVYRLDSYKLGKCLKKYFWNGFTSVFNPQQASQRKFCPYCCHEVSNNEYFDRFGIFSFGCKNCRIEINQEEFNKVIEKMKDFSKEEFDLALKYFEKEKDGIEEEIKNSSISFILKEPLSYNAFHYLICSGGFFNIDSK